MTSLEPRPGAARGDLPGTSDGWCARLPGSTVVAVGGRLARADVPGFCDRVCALLDWTGDGPLECDVRAVVTPDAAVVDAMARLQLAAARRGRRVHLRGASPALRELLGLMGLAGVLPLAEPLRVELEGQPEEREQGDRIEEERQLDDPVA